jgi:hypothetical protein
LQTQTINTRYCEETTAEEQTQKAKMDFFRRFDVEKLRSSLKLAETRIDLMKNKKTNEIKKQKLEIASLLRNGKQEELARIRTEHIVREDFNIEVLGILGLLCALVKERTKLLDHSATIPYDMKESCTTLIYAADRVNDVPELSIIKQQLMLKFKKELTAWMDTEAKTKENVNERVFEKLSVKPPNAFIVTSYMKHIAEENGVDWSPDDSDLTMSRFDQPAAAPTGLSITAGAGSGIRAPYYVSDGSLSHLPSQGIVEPMFPGNSSSKPGGGAGGGGGGAIPSLFNPGVPAGGAPVVPPLKPSMTTTAIPLLGTATIAAAAASKKKTEQEQKPAPEYVVLGESTGGHNLFPPAAPVTTNAAAVPGYDELAARFEALKRG